MIKWALFKWNQFLKIVLITTNNFARDTKSIIKKKLSLVTDYRIFTLHFRINSCQNCMKTSIDKLRTPPNSPFELKECKKQVSLK